MIRRWYIRRIFFIIPPPHILARRLNTSKSHSASPSRTNAPLLSTQSQRDRGDEGEKGYSCEVLTELRLVEMIDENIRRTIAAIPPFDIFR
jgi:hypothetical protein